MTRISDRLVVQLLDGPSFDDVLVIMDESAGTEIAVPFDGGAALNLYAALNYLLRAAGCDIPEVTLTMADPGAVNIGPPTVVPNEGRPERKYPPLDVRPFDEQANQNVRPF